MMKQGFVFSKTSLRNFLNVLDDDATDTLAGNNGSDWFLAVSDQTATAPDKFRGDIVEDDFTELA